MGFDLLWWEVVLSVGSMENSFQYRGDLAETALPEILYTVDRFQVPGVIEASRDGVVKQVFIKEGNVVHAVSTDRNDSLGAYLQRSGVITPEAYLATRVLASGARLMPCRMTWRMGIWMRTESGSRNSPMLKMTLPSCQ